MNDLEKLEVKLQLSDCQIQIQNKNKQLKEKNKRLKELYNSYEEKLFYILYKNYSNFLWSPHKFAIYYDKSSLKEIMKSIIFADFEGHRDSIEQEELENNLIDSINSYFKSNKKDWFVSAINNIFTPHFSQFRDIYAGHSDMINDTNKLFIELNKTLKQNNEFNNDLKSELQILDAREKILKEIVES